MSIQLIGTILSALVSLALLASGAAKLAKKPAIVKNLTDLGFNQDSLRGIGITEILSVFIYMIPQTSFIGAILVTGYMGGAISAHVRVKDKFVIQIVFPVLFWLGYGLRNEALMKQILGL